MATGEKKEISSNLIKIGILKLIPDNLDPCGIVVVRDHLVITDWESYKVRVYSCHDGMLLSSSHRLESGPYGVCCVAMYNGSITVMSVQDSGLISRGTTFDLRPSFDRCDGLAVFRDKIVVSGVKDNMIYWCNVSLRDGRLDNLQKVCGVGFSFLTMKENMIYILCDAKSPDNNGVYGFNLLNPSQPAFRYKREELGLRGITVDDNGYLYLSDWISNSIHHLTGKCELVAIYTEGIPHDPCTIFWDNGILYITAANVISMFETPQQASAGPMPSAPISDKDRFMCIAYLLNDVGSKVLRQLFHGMVTPTCTLDQHLANNRSKINSLLKTKVLNVSQMDIMFPPNGDPTNLTDYDITLLSALFNNIVPSLGHQEKNLIKRLRDNRNKLYGHTKSCKMNASDFQTCWSDISSTLITLSQQCVDTKFKNEILKEIQQTQVPDASYLSMIHTFDSRMKRIEQILESNKTSTSET